MFKGHKGWSSLPNSVHIPDWDNRKESTMSQAKWCDFPDPETNAPNQIGHSFSARDPLTQHRSQTRKAQRRTGDSYGKSTYQDYDEIIEEVDICGYHVQKEDELWNPPTPGKTAKATPKALTQDEQTEDYLRGYHDAKAE